MWLVVDLFAALSNALRNRSEGGSVAGSMPFGVLVLLEAYRTARIGGLS